MSTRYGGYLKVSLGLLSLILVVAATPAEVSTIVMQDGYFIEAGSDATVEVVGNAVSEARFAGGALSVVVLAEEPSAGATTFADAVLDQLVSDSGTVLVVAPDTVGWASKNDIWTNGQLDAALDASLDGSSSDDVVSIFVSELLAPSSSGSSGILILVVIVVALGGAFAYFALRASKRQKREAAEQVQKLRSTAQLQIDAIANDILDLEDEIKISENAQAREHYSAAVDTYTTASERLAAMSSGRQIAKFNYELDLAVWRLDAAEAVLDDNPVPDKPDPPAYTPPPVLSEAQPQGSSGSTAGVSAPIPQFERRSTRRSSFGAQDMLTAVLATQAMGGLGRRGRRSYRSSGRSGSIPRMRGGGRRR